MPPVMMVGKFGWASNHHWLIQSPLMRSSVELSGAEDLFCARGLGSLWLLLWVPGSLSSTLKEAIWEVRMKAEQTRTEPLF